MSNLPQDYFRRLECRTFNSTKPPQPGAQRIGFEWFAWADQDALSRAINDGCFDIEATSKQERIDELACDLRAYAATCSELDGAVKAAQKRIDKLETELEEAKKK